MKGEGSNAGNLILNLILNLIPEKMMAAASWRGGGRGGEEEEEEEEEEEGDEKEKGKIDAASVILSRRCATLYYKFREKKNILTRFLFDARQL